MLYVCMLRNTSAGLFLDFATNIHLILRMDWLDLGGQGHFDLLENLIH